jgi:hypothetical protein
MNTDNVVIFPGVTRLDMPPKLTLEAASRADLQAVAILGYDADGEVFVSSSISGGPELLWLLETVKLMLLHAGGATPNDD